MARGDVSSRQMRGRTREGADGKCAEPLGPGPSLALAGSNLKARAGPGGLRTTRQNTVLPARHPFTTEGDGTA